MKLDASAEKTATITMTESSVGSSSEANSPVSFAIMGKREEKIEELDELMDNLDVGEAMGHLDLEQKDFTTRSSGISGNMHQVCVIITEVAEENNDDDNLVVDTQGNNPRSNSRKEKEKVHVSAEEWRIIMSAINHGTEVPTNSRREALMGCQYALHQCKKKLLAQKSELRKSQESYSASSRSYWSEYGETSDSSKERHHEPKHSRRKTARGREEERARSISTSL
jgi:hypothetical protein